MERLSVWPLRTRIFRRGEDLAAFVIEHVPKEEIGEKMIVAVTSKIMSLAEHRLVPQAEIDKTSLVKREADQFLGEVGYGISLTVKEGLFIPSAGIDESNSESGEYILYPSAPFDSCRDLWNKLREAWKVRELGIVLTDSHTTPLRKGVTGISLAHWGFHGVRHLVGTKDLFGRELKVTNMNLADGLAATAVMVMGEGNESQPLALVSGAQVDFTADTDPNEVRMPLKEDLYFPILDRLMGERK